jgi:hypothetical protein
LDVINAELSKRGLERYKAGSFESREIVPFQISAADLEHVL